MAAVASFQSSRVARWALPLAVIATLCGCGGGSGAGPHTSSTSGGGSDTWTPGVFQPASKYAALCASPRPGTSDLQGTTEDENNWLRSWTHQLYLWYDEVQDVDPALHTTADYFQLMKTTQTTSSGAPKDRFHFTYPTSVWDSLSQSDVEVGYGIQFEIVQSSPPRSVRIAYLQSAAELPSQTAAAGLVRGDTVLQVDGVDVVNATDQASVNTINAGLAPATAGETHTLEVLDPGASTPRTVQLQSADVT
ncbi:MAG TPA: hypothetical protein VF745_04050, partial [Steroidobacteraceae bacterium]